MACPYEVNSWRKASICGPSFASRLSSPLVPDGTLGIQLDQDLAFLHLPVKHQGAAHKPGRHRRVDVIRAVATSNLAERLTS